MNSNVKVVHAAIKQPTYERMQGQCKFYSHERGYGFIKIPNKPDVFFTNKTLEKAKIDKVKENDILEFDWVPSNELGKGGKAINIKKVV